MGKKREIRGQASNTSKGSQKRLCPTWRAHALSQGTATLHPQLTLPTLHPCGTKQCILVVRVMGSRARLSGFKTQLCHSLAVKPTASCLIFLCLSFHTYKMGIIIVIFNHIVVGIKSINTYKVLKQL